MSAFLPCKTVNQSQPSIQNIPVSKFDLKGENQSTMVRPQISSGLSDETKKKKTPAVKFLDLIFRNNFFVFNFSKMCSR